MKKLAVTLMCLALWLSGCSLLFDKGETKKGESLPRPLTASEQEIVKADRTFSYDLFRTTLQNENDDNIFISPLSVSMALGMTVNGAAGKTREEMKSVLHLQDMDMQSINESYLSLIELLRSADPKVNMKVANSIWTREGFTVNEDFKKTVEEFFKARISSLDFSDPSAADQINQWVRDNTDGLIDSIVDGSIPREVVMYLINAIYFQADWQYQFDPEDTAPKEFKTPNDLLTVDMMSQKNDLAAYVSEEVEILDLAYGDSLFSMTLLMPHDDQQRIGEFVQDKLTADNMQFWLSELSVEETQIEVPKFKIEYDLKMNELLRGMGMESAFNTDKADFSNINSDRQLFISKIKHKAFVEVNEEGTEAAAVTSVGVGVTSVGPKVRTLKFNRPFVFVIRERTSGTILFMGKVSDPT
jgi:serpin B